MDIADNFLEEIGDLLNDLENDLKNIRDIWKQNGICSEEDWQDRYAQSWLHGATTPQERNELEQWLFDQPPLSGVACSLAKQHYVRWTNSINNTEGCDVNEVDLLKPEENELLYIYISRLAENLINKTKVRKKENLALNSL